MPRGESAGVFRVTPYVRGATVESKYAADETVIVYGTVDNVTTGLVFTCLNETAFLNDLAVGA